ncbi:phenylalanine--tRNA ligase subunit beta [archaeon]|nr:MAG: phenylalanine--tRNA ligase subunit beta [archaeon]
MPIIEVNLGDLERLTGMTLTVDKLQEIIFSTKCEIDSVSEDTIFIEVSADRPDLFSAEGIARLIRTLHLGKSSIYKIKDGETTLTVDSSVKDVRPFIACAIVRDLSLYEESVKQIMQLQEKLHITYCRNRSKASIGVYDMDTLTPPFKYVALSPDQISFKPLGYSTEMTAEEILQITEKGMEYAHLLEDKPRYPLLLDSRNIVLSMPPIINSEDTKVTVDTTDVFIDVTGIHWKTVNKMLSIMAVNISERGKGEIERVKIILPENKSIYTPVTNEKAFKISIDYIRKMLGIDIDEKFVEEKLRAHGFTVKSISENELLITPPFYRVDFLHPIDFVEEVAIIYGYNNLSPIPPKVFTFGSLTDETVLSEKVKDIMIGLGFQEICSFTFTNRDILFKKTLRLEEEVVEVEKPISLEYTVLRDRLFPILLDFVSKNAHAELPQKIFEVGDVVKVDLKYETKAKNFRHICAMITDDTLSFEAIQAPLFALMKALNLKVSLRPLTKPYFIEGRAAEVLVDKEHVGETGEVNPEVLLNFGIRTPVAFFEVNLTTLLPKVKKKFPYIFYGR